MLQIWWEAWLGARLQQKTPLTVLCQCIVSYTACNIKLYHIRSACGLSRSVMSNSLQPHELEPTRLLCPWNFPGKNSGVGFHFLFHGVFFPIEGSNLRLLQLLHWQRGSLPLSHLGSPISGLTCTKYGIFFLHYFTLDFFFKCPVVGI